MIYDNLIDECCKDGLNVQELDMNTKGLYCNGVIGISKRIETTSEKLCVLSEELGHHHTSCGNILDQRKVTNNKQEKRARNWGYEKLVSLEKLITAYKSDCKNRFEIAEFLDVTELFFDDAITHYKEKYGMYHEFDKYLIYFDPLGIMESFER
jgi:hypothetical protein